MKPAPYAFCALLVLALCACSDDNAPGGTGGDGGGDQNPGDVADTGGDGGGGDGGGDVGDGGGDIGGDQGGDQNVDQGGDGGDVAFRSCVPNPNGEECGNGLDDNCDGHVDERCGCAPDGSSQSCYLGAETDLDQPAGRCQAGTQSCAFEFWTDCTGAIGPIDELCGNEIDDDCDGTVDNGCEQEGPVAICPANFEDDVLSTYTLVGDYELVDGDQIQTFFWTEVSAPPGHSRDIQSSGDTITFFADVAGQYTFEFYVQSDNGSDTCQTLFTAGTADALRIEMFWNPDYNEGEGLPRDRSDMDLYLVRDPDAGGASCGSDSDCPGYDNSSHYTNGQACNTDIDECEFYYYRDNPAQVGLPHRGYANQDSCHWRNCNTCPNGIEDLAEYADHPCQELDDVELVRECLCRYRLSNPPPGLTPEDVWPEPILNWGTADDFEDDPRLDLDDTEGKGPENINVRLPEAGKYRVAVHFFNPDGFGTVIDGGFRTNPVQVRILCAENEIFASEQVTLKSTNSIPFGYWQGDLWEVGDLTISYDGANMNCDFQEFGDASCRRICTLEQSDGGCSASERQACE